MLNCQSYGRCENGQNWAHVVRGVRSKKRNDGSALGVVYAPLVSVMHAGLSNTVPQYVLQYAQLKWTLLLH